MDVLLLGKHTMPRNGGVERHLDALFQGFHAVGGVRASLLACNERFGTEFDDWNGFRTVRASRLFDINRVPMARLFPPTVAGVATAVSITPGYAWWLRRLSDVDVIHLQGPNPIAELALLAARPRVPLVITEQCGIPADLPMARNYKRLRRRLLERADAFIVLSEQFLESSDLTPDQKARTTVIPACLDGARFTAEAPAVARARQILGDASPAVLFVGRLVDYKGIDVLIRAMKGAPGTLFIVGVGPEERRLRALTDRLGLTARVRFLGPLDDPTMMALMQESDVLVLPSVDNREGYGLVLTESHLMGTPTISTELGTGTSWVNQHGQTGLVVPPKDAGALARAIQAVADDPAAAKAWGEAAQTRARSQFAGDAMARSTIEVYRSVT